MSLDQLSAATSAGADLERSADDLERATERAWQLRSSAPQEALKLVAELQHGSSSAWLGLKLTAIRAGALLALDDPHGAKQAVLAGIQELTDLLGAASESNAAGVDRARLAGRLALLDVTAVPGEHAAVVTELLQVGLRSACLGNDIENALPFGKAALTTAEHFRLPLAAARVHSDLASAYGMREFQGRAIDHLRAGIATLEEAGEPVMPALLNNLGNVYMSSRRLDEALGCFERARLGFAAAGDRLREAIAASNAGRALVEQRRHREGAALLVQALGIFRELGRRPYIGATLGKLGSCYSEMGESDRAKGWFEAAIATFAGAELPFECEVRQAYGHELLRTGEIERALLEFEHAEVGARRDGAEVTAYSLVKDQAQALAELGRHEEAFSRLSLYLERSDEVRAEQSESMLNVMLSELESGLTNDHELPALSSRVLAEANRTLRSQAERLEKISSTDELTDLYNRRFFNRQLEEELRRARAGGRPLTLILFDVDNFKAINDEHSHLVGDEVLRLVAAKLRGSFRHSDIVARWGGEEFAVLLPQTDREGAMAVADKARAVVAAVDWAAVAPDLLVTVSAGIAGLAELAADESAVALLKLVDGRLYSAKHEGRNRIVAS